jgi:hypothetical protein
VPRRARHVVDRALDYAALEASGLRASQIAARRRRSKAHVSILLRLGQALQGCAPEELAALRSERITWKLAQRIVRADVPAAVIRERLRLALGGFSGYTVDRRRHRKGRESVAGSGTGGRAIDPLRVPPGTFVWQWDPTWAARDPVGYVEAYRSFLARLQRGMTSRLRGAAATRTSGSAPLAGQSLRQLAASVARQSPDPLAAATPEEHQALALLAEVDTLLRGARASAAD